METSVEVIFNKESKTYWAGELITGKVVVVSDDEKNLRLIKALRVRGKGIATVDLKFGASETIENFVDEEAKVFTDKLVKTTSTKHETETVRYEYPIQFQLNKALPSSFKTPYGKLEYFLKASLPTGQAATYFEGKAHFNVVGVLDLNTKKSLRHPVELKLEAKMISLLLGESGTVNFFLRIPQKAYAIGDRIELHQEIENKSRQHVKANISLIQKITYEIMGSVRLDKKNKMKIFGKDIAPNSNNITASQTFEIPQVPITSDIRLKTEGKVIKINYFLKYELVGSPAWTNKMKGFIPITIGSIGFKPVQKKGKNVEKNSEEEKDSGSSTTSTPVEPQPNE